MADQPSYTGTGIPFSFQVSVTPGNSAFGPITDQHAAVGVPSDLVQIQNATDMAMGLTIGTDIFYISSQQATTLPIPKNGAGLAYSLTNNSGSTQVGTVTFIWLWNGQESPQPDGPLAGPPTGSGGGGVITNYALEVGGNLQTLKNNFSVFSNSGQQVTYYDSDTTITLASGLLMMGSKGTAAGTATPGNSRVIQTDAVGRLVIAPSSSSSVSITSPVDGSGYVNVDVQTSALPAGAATAANQTSVIAATGAAVPADAIMVGGSDGTDLRAIATDAGGQVKVLLEGGTLPVPAAPSNSSNISAATLQVKNAAGTLYGVTGYSSIAQYFQLLDATSLSSGVTVPKVVVNLPAASSFALDYATLGRAFATGIYAAFSSTEATFTTGTAGTIDAQYV